MNILVDVGITYKNIKEALSQFELSISDINIILITHEHIDHVRGLEVLKKNHDIPVYLTSGTKQGLNFNLEHYQTFKDGDSLKFEDIIVEVVATSHDANEPCCFIFEQNSNKYVHLTDTGYITKKIEEKTQNANFYVIESNYEDDILIVNPKYPFVTKKRILSEKGHLSNIQCQEYISKIIGDQTNVVCFAHLSPNNNHPELVNTLHENLCCDYHVLAKSETIEVSYASRYNSSR